MTHDPAAAAFLDKLDDLYLPPSLSDDQLAAEMQHRYGKDWRYTAEWGSWLHWTGAVWEKDKVGAVLELIRTHMREVMSHEPADLLTPAAQRALTSRKSYANIATVWQSDTKTATTGDLWDADPWQLATPDGVIDLQTGHIHPAKREAYQTKLTACSPNGEAPQWCTFLDTVTNGDTELQDYLQRLMGYCLTGVTTEQMLAFFYGTGANGKGVFLRTVGNILKDYSCTSSVDVFAESKGDGPHKNVFARLNKMRLVSAQETEEGKKWAESRLKQFTGGDKIQANFMRQDEFEFAPTFKLLFAGNHKPHLRSVDEAMRRRVHIVPFTITIPPEERDPLLDEKLVPEYPGILKWMVDGCLSWQRQGLCPPESVLSATSDYLESEDNLGAWLTECCEQGEDKSVAVPTLYKSYVATCEEQHEYAWSQKRWLSNLQARGFQVEKLLGLRMLRGLDLKPGAEPEAPTYNRWDR